jgi:hypothetical protein
MHIIPGIKRFHLTSLSSNGSCKAKRISLHKETENTDFCSKELNSNEDDENNPTNVLRQMTLRY